MLPLFARPQSRELDQFDRHVVHCLQYLKREHRGVQYLLSSLQVVPASFCHALVESTTHLHVHDPFQIIDMDTAFLSCYQRCS